MNNKDNIQTIMAAFQFRYACKKFNPEKKIADSDFKLILEAGRLSPSSWGFEPWKFLVIQNKSLRQKLFPLAWGAQNSLSGASHFVIILARKKIDMIYNSTYINDFMKNIKKLPSDIAENINASYEEFQKNDFNLLESDRAIFDWSCKQTYIALGNMLTVAAVAQIDSCPIEGFNREAVEKLLVEENLLDTKHFGVSVMAGFGYRDEEPHREKTRQNLDDIVQFIK